MSIEIFRTFGRLIDQRKGDLRQKEVSLHIRDTADTVQLPANLCEQTVLVAVRIERQQRLSAEAELRDEIGVRLCQQDAPESPDGKRSAVLRPERDRALIGEMQIQRLAADDECRIEALEPVGMIFAPDCRIFLGQSAVKCSKQRGSICD